MLRQWMIEDGAVVRKGDAVAVVESMKTETLIRAPENGRIRLEAASRATLAFGDVPAWLYESDDDRTD